MIFVVIHYEDLLFHLGVLPDWVIGEADLEQFIAKEVPGCNYVIFWGFLFLEVSKVYHSETLFEKCHTLSFLSNAYNLGAI